MPSELQACAHLRSQPPCAPNCTAPQLPPTSSASHPPCLPSPCTSPLHLTPLGPWRLSRTWRVPRCGGRVPCRGRARCSGRVVRRGREARRGLGSCSPLASARRTTADGRALVLGQQLFRELRCSYPPPPVRCSYPLSAALTPLYAALTPLSAALTPTCPLILPPCPLLLSPPGSSQPAPQTPRRGENRHRCTPKFSRLALDNKTVLL